MNARVDELRREFDASFARPPSVEAPDVEDVLAIRVAGDPYGLRLREIAGLARAGALAPLPSRRAEACGLATVHGAIVPVFSLARLLGYPPRREDVRWLALAGGPDPLALAVEAFEQFLRLPRAAICAPDAPQPGRPFVVQVARIGDRPRPLIDVPSVVERIRSTP